MNSNITYTKLVQLISDFASLHKQINSFYFGQMSDFQAKEVDFPALIIIPTSATVEQGLTTITLSTFLFDKLNEDRSNLTQVFSDTLQIIQDLYSYLKTIDYYGAKSMVNLTSYPDELPATVAGWMGNFLFRLPFDASQCNLPVEPTPVYSLPTFVFGNTDYVKMTLVGSADLTVDGIQYDNQSGIVIYTFSGQTDRTIVFSNASTLTELHIGNAQDLENVISATNIELFTNLKTLNLPYNNLTTFDVSKSTSLTELNVNVNQLTSLLIGDNLMILGCETNYLTSTNINYLLAKLVPNISQGVGLFASYNQTPSAPPTGQGITDKATLVSAGWNVYTD